MTDPMYELILEKIHKEFINKEYEKERIRDILLKIANKADSSLYYCHDNTEEMRSTITEIGQLTIKALSETIK